MNVDYLHRTKTEWAIEEFQDSILRIGNTQLIIFLILAYFICNLKEVWKKKVLCSCHVLVMEAGKKEIKY